MSSRQRFPYKIKDGSVVVTIYRNKSDRTKSGWLYQMRWHDGNAHRTQQFADLSKAETEARILAGQLRAGRHEDEVISREDLDLLTSAREIVGDTPLIQALQEWKRCSDLTSGNLLEAAQVWKRANSGAKRISLEEAVRLFKAAKKRQGVDVALTYKNRLERLQDAFPHHSLTGVTTPTLNRYLAQFEDPVSRNTHRKNIVTMWRWCRKQGYLPDTARTAAENTDRASEANDKPVGIISPTTAKEILGWVFNDHPHYLAPVVLAIFTGMRPCEIHKQVWEDIDLEAGTLHVTNAKKRTVRDRLVEIGPVGVEWLMLCGGRSGRICTNEAITRVREIHKKKTEESLPVNAFRHSYISYKIAIGFTVGQVAAIAGNTERVIHKDYRRPRPKSEGEAWFALTPEAVLNSQDNVIPMEAGS